MNSKKIIKLIKADGWKKVRQKGSHCHFQHPEKRGTITVPHPSRNIHPKTLASIERLSGVNLTGRKRKRKK